MKIHLNQEEIQRAIADKYVNPLVDYDAMMQAEDGIKVTIELKATRGAEGMTCDIVIGEDHSDKPLGIADKVQTARAANALEPAVEEEVAQDLAGKAAGSNLGSQATEQPVEAPKRRGRPPGSKNKATLEAEASANDTGEGAAPEEVAEAVQEDKPEPTPFVKSGGLFSNRNKQEDPAPEPEAETESEAEAEPEPSEEDTLAAEAQRTEPQEPAEKEAPKPTRSLFGNMNRSQS